MTDQAPGAAGAGQGEPASSTAAALTTPPPQAAPAPTVPTWLEGVDQTTVSYVQNKGWTEPKQVLESYRNLEKLMGADRAGNTVVLPKPDASPEEVGKFYDRLGRPADPTGYKFQIPDGGDPEFAKGAAAKMHELGLSQKQGEALASWWNEQAASAQATHRQKAEDAFREDDQALRREWGAAFQQNLTAAQAAARGLGLDAAAIDRLQGALGHKGTMDLLYKIGSKVGESQFVTGGDTQRFGAAMTPGQAKARIQELTRDKNFVARYVSKDAEAVAEMKRLHEFAYTEQ